MGHVDYGCRRDGVGMAVFYEKLDCVVRIDCVAGVLERCDEAVWDTHLAGENDCWGILIEPPFGFQE